MKFSTRAEYGLKAMTNLAKSFPEKKSLFLISKEEGISAKYLEQLMATLKKNKLIRSYKGKNGGYVLFKKPDLTKVGEIVEILEGSIAPMKCDQHQCPICRCSSRIVWDKLGKQIRKTLYGIKLSELI